MPSITKNWSRIFTCCGLIATVLGCSPQKDESTSSSETIPAYAFENSIRQAAGILKWNNQALKGQLLLRLLQQDREGGRAAISKADSLIAALETALPETTDSSTPATLEEAEALDAHFSALTSAFAQILGNNEDWSNDLSEHLGKMSFSGWQNVSLSDQVLDLSFQAQALYNRFLLYAVDHWPPVDAAAAGIIPMISPLTLSPTVGNYFEADIFVGNVLTGQPNITVKADGAVIPVRNGFATIKEPCPQPGRKIIKLEVLHRNPSTGEISSFLRQYSYQVLPEVN